MCGMKKGTEKGKELFSRGKKTGVGPNFTGQLCGILQSQRQQGQPVDWLNL